MVGKPLRIATRQSKLALWQAHFVRDRLLEAHPDLAVEFVGITTKGDRWLQAPLSDVGGKGLFIKELEAAMLDGRADIAVHSMKDLPAQLPDEFELPVIGYRQDVRDVLVAPAIDAGQPLLSLPKGARVGSSSLRRQAQLLHQRPDLVVMPIRGNVDTRLKKLADGEYDAIVLAAAGLNRLGLENLGLDETKVHPLSEEVCLPAPGQGALGIECPRDSDVKALLLPLADEDAHACVTAERGISAGLGADCSLPIAARASKFGNGVRLAARLCSGDGKRILSARGEGVEPLYVASQVVDELFTLGARDILDALTDPSSGG